MMQGAYDEENHCSEYQLEFLRGTQVPSLLQPLLLLPIITFITFS